VISAWRRRIHNSGRLASLTTIPGGKMLEWKFRLVILLALAASIAVALGSFGWFTQYSW
jgi:hypothetical protein